jgi:hypothetical protein
MSQRNPDQNELIVNYMRLRQTVGWIGTLLPIVLLAGAAFTSTARPDSMSGYYYTDMRDIFVGTLWALGVFLVAYRGYDKVDDSITNVAGFAAIGVALFPTKPAVCTAGPGACPASSVTRLSTHQQVVGDIHLVLAAVTLIALGLMALRFAKQTKQRFATENAIYLGSGAIVLCCVLLAALFALLPASVKGRWPWLFFFEAVAVFAFGVSWFVKGRTIQGVRAWIKARRGRTSGTTDPGPEGSPVTEQSDQAATV